ncbi:MAG: cation transporter [Selenomonas sp.]|nr:cation transporter [Selenomonas sp.]
MTEIDVLKKDTAYLSIISNTVLVLLKLIVGIWGGAVSLISEALHSSVDLLASLIAFWAVKKSVTPPDMEHDYGHGKFENLSAAVEALLIVAAAGGIVYEAVEHMGQEKMPAMLELGVVIMLVSIVINLWVSQRLIKVGRMTDSQALEADGLHLRADVWTSVGVMLGLVLMQFTGWAWLDGVIAIVVAVIIFREGWKMVVSSTLELTDVSLPEEQESRIMAIIDAVPEVVGCHCLRTRKSGSYKLLDVHVLFNGNMHLSHVHAICDELEDQIRAEFGSFDILIHPEPAGIHAPETKESQYENAKKTAEIEES